MDLTQNGGVDIAEVHRLVRRSIDLQMEHHELQRGELARQKHTLDAIAADISDIKGHLRRAHRASLADPAELAGDPGAVGLGATPSLWQRARANQWATIAMMVATALATAATTYATAHHPTGESRTVGETARPSIGGGSADAGDHRP